MSLLKRIAKVLFSSDMEIDDMKELTKNKYIKKGRMPEKVVVYFSQHIGKESECCVSCGNHVKEGQVIGKASGVLSSNVHAPISGKVVEIKNYRNSTGRSGKGVMIESDGKEKVWKKKDAGNISSEKIIKAVESAGVVGMGGATFPTYFKMNGALKSRIKDYIVNGAECEPYITADQRLMEEKTKEIFCGIQLMVKATKAKHAYFGIEDNKRYAIRKFKGIAINHDWFDVEELESRYPQGAEKEMIKNILGKEVPCGGLPSDVGVAVNNVGTVFAVYEALYYSKPLIERVVTVTGNGVKNPKNIFAKIGTPVKDLIDECGGYKSNVSKIIVGGPMMGFAQSDDKIYVTKGMSCILVMKGSDDDSAEERPCIRCGRCIDACPMKLNPYIISAYSQRDKFDDAKDAGVLNCYECGKCAFVCPVRRPMTQYMRYAKEGIKKRGDTKK